MLITIFFIVLAGLIFFLLSSKTTLKPILFNIEHFLWGNIHPAELSKFLYLSRIAIIIMTCTWGLKTLKDSLFIDFVGRESLTLAKNTSIAILIPLVLLYNYAITKIALEKLFSIICITYASLFIGTTTLHYYINAGYILPIPSSIIGWIYYIGIESFASLLVSHYFTYLASINTTESAKRGYGLIIVATQLGNLAGPTCVILTIQQYGFNALICFFALLALSVPFFIYQFITRIPKNLRQSDENKADTHLEAATEVATSKTSFLEGIRLLYKSPYLLGLATITTMQEIISQMLDLQFKIQISYHYHGPDFAAYMGSYAQMNAILGILFGFFGTSFLLRKLEIKNCLILYPALLAAVVTFVWYFPATQFFFAGMIIIKTLGYTLNRPIQEIMFIPTTKMVKTQVKSIVDSLGKRGGKSLGASILRALSSLDSQLLTSTTFASLGLLTMWVGIAIKTGSKYEKLMKNKEIIG
ncbi:hypothetical protein FJ366_01405 [Candidatus Dependentiae bacterium]|nr:hypothetical protein [Candidatus Dependentiae bacterium]